MFFKKPTPPTPKYDLELDKTKDLLRVFINLKAFESDGYKILSIERVNWDSEDEKTIVYTLKNGAFDDHFFEISRAQHLQLISDWEKQ